MSLETLTAVVTGAGRGIGRAIALKLAEAGANVVCLSRTEANSQKVADEITALGRQSWAVAVDVGATAAVEAAVAKILEDTGGVNILVNNAATNPYFGPTMEIDKARYDKTFQVNLDAPIFWSQAAWKHAFSERPGVIINVASVGGLRAEFGLGTYNLTKAALIHLTRQLASEIGPSRVVGIAPGLVQTDFASYLVENFGDKLAAALPTKRLGEPQDIANLATFLASDLASWITGETYVIDGGAGVASVG